MSKMVTYIAGVNHRPGARQRLAGLLPGECLLPAREPDNAYDKNAVALYDGDLHVGYVPAADAPAVAKALTQGLNVRVAYKGAPSTTTIEITWGDRA
jgi:hypothetical protein